MDHAGHRRQVAADQARIGHGVDPADRDVRQVMALMRVLYDRVRTSVARRSVSPLMHYVFDNYSRSAERLADIEVACRRGCAHCCHSWVEATAPELVYIAKSLTGQRRAQATAAALATVEITGRMNHAERLRFVAACPLLEDGACSIYPVRPLVCRSAFSVDAGACERSFIQLSGLAFATPAPFKQIRTDYWLAMAGALKKAGISHRGIEFASGLKIALTEPDVERRLLAGEDVFAGAVRPAHDDVFALAEASEIYEAAFA